MQRVLDVNAGPNLVGHGSMISHRLSAANTSDIRMVLHPGITASNRYFCDRDPNCLGQAPAGIPMPVNISGEADDVDMQWVFFKPISEGGLGCTIEGDLRTCPKYDWATHTAHPTERITLPEAHGLWTMTVLDLGNETAGAGIRNCEQCSLGGAHSNQWFIRIRNDEPTEPAPGNGNTEPAPGNGNTDTDTPPPGDGNANLCRNIPSNWLGDEDCDCAVGQTPAQAFACGDVSCEGAASCQYCYDAERHITDC